MTTKKRTLFLICGLILITVFAGAEGQKEAAGKYPTKSVQVFIGAVAGGSSDVIARMVFAEVEKALGKPFAIVNKAGGTGQLSLLEVAKAPKDGHTLGYLTDFETLMAHATLSDLGFTLDELELICSVSRGTNAIILAPNFPGEKSFKGFIEYAKANPGKITIANTSLAQVLILKSMEQQAGIKVTPMQFKGGAESYNALIGGHVSAAIIGTRFSRQGAEKGAVTLAVTSHERIDLLPAVPSLKELGYDIVNNEVTRIFVAPKGTPAHVISTLENTIKEVTNNESFKDRLRKSEEMYEFRSGEKMRNIFNQKAESLKKILQENPDILKK